MTLRVSVLLAVWPWGLLVLGCAQIQLQEGGSEKPALPAPQLAHNSIILEMTTVMVPEEDQMGASSFWAEVDEQVIPVERRRRLAAAGIRCGIVGNQLPGALAELLVPDSQAQVVDEQGQPLDVAGPRQRRLQCRQGQRQRILLSEAKPEMSVLWRDGSRVLGATFADAQPFFVLRAFPQQNGQAQIELTPEIHHGSPKNRWVGRDGMFLLETGKEQRVFDDLMIETTLSPGEFLLIGSTEEYQGLGGCIFHGDGHDAKRNVILLRLAQTQLDDLQASSSQSKPDPLVTRVE